MKSARRVAWLLAGCAVLGLVLAVFWPALSRPGLGKLVVEAAGEDMEVTIAGGGVLRRAAGPCEMSLPAGSYEVWCSWKGRRGRALWVDVPAGGEVEARPASPVPVRPSPLPFVVLAHGDEPEQSFATLEKAVGQTRPGGTIEVHGNGPFVGRPAQTDRDLVIRAGPGYRPVLRLAPDAVGALIDTTASLVLEGLELDARPADDGPANHRRAVQASGPALYLVHCRLRQVGENNGILARTATCRVRRCDLATNDWSALDWGATTGGRLVLEESLFLHYVLVPVASGVGDVGVEVRRCTFATPGACFELRYFAAPPGGGPALRITAQDTVWAGGVVLLFNLWRDDKLDAATSAAYLRQLASWWDRGNNVYPAGGRLLAHAVKSEELEMEPEVTTLAQWQKVWGLEELKAQLLEVRFAGMDVDERTPADLDRLQPADFRLQPGSSGADVDVVGPGLAYDRWRQTPEYRAWQKETGQPEVEE